MFLGKRRITATKRVKGGRSAARCLAILVAATASMLALPATPAGAVTFKPVDVNDHPLPTGCWPDPCSLRDAVVRAEANSTADIIVLGEGRYTLSLPIAGSDDAYTGDLDITKPEQLTIIGAGPAKTIIDAQGIDRVFDIAGGAEVYIRAVTITGGSAEVDPRTTHEHGGGIHNHGKVILVETSLVGNQVVRPLTLHPVTKQTLPWGGGGLTNAGWAELTNVTVANNSVPDWQGNQGHGGGIENLGRLTLGSVTVAYNSATYGGGVAHRSGNSAIKNTILKWNTPGDCWGSTSMVSWGNNLLGSCTPSLKSGASADVSGDPKFATALRTTDGLTEYLYPLQSGSAAIDTGGSSDCPTWLPSGASLVSTACPGTDEIRTTRPRDGNGNGTAEFDIGAFEFVPPARLANFDVVFAKRPYKIWLGDKLVYALVVANHGAAAEDVVLEYVLPEGAELLEASEGCDVEKVLTCKLGALEEGAMVEVRIAVMPTVPGLARSEAFVSSVTPDENEEDNRAVAETEVVAE
jgi:hypothetical protein